MEELLRKKGFVIKKIVPLWLDAIYISALSEKAKGGKLCLAKGLVIGIWSNVKASIQTKNFLVLCMCSQKKTNRGRLKAQTLASCPKDKKIKKIAENQSMRLFVIA